METLVCHAEAMWQTSHCFCTALPKHIYFETKLFLLLREGEKENQQRFTLGPDWDPSTDLLTTAGLQVLLLYCVKPAWSSCFDISTVHPGWVIMSYKAHWPCQALSTLSKLAQCMRGGGTFCGCLVSTNTHKHAHLDHGCLPARLKGWSQWQKEI